MPGLIMASSLRICAMAGSTLIGPSGGGNVLVNQELVEHVGLVIEVEAAIGRADNRPHRIPQERLLPCRADLGPLPGAEWMAHKGSLNGSSLKSPITSTGV